MSSASSFFTYVFLSEPSGGRLFSGLNLAKKPPLCAHAEHCLARALRVRRHPAHGVSQRPSHATWTASEGEPVVSAREERRQGATGVDKKKAPLNAKNVTPLSPLPSVPRTRAERREQRQFRVHPDVRVLTPISERSLKDAARGVACSCGTAVSSASSIASSDRDAVDVCFSIEQRPACAIGGADRFVGSCA